MTVLSIVLQSLLIAYYVFSGSAKIAGPNTGWMCSTV